MLRNNETHIVPYINRGIKPTDWVYWDDEFKGQLLEKELVDSISSKKGMGRSNLYFVENDGVTYQVVSGFKYRKHNEFRYLNGDIVAPGTELQIQNQTYFHGEKEVVTFGTYLEKKDYEEKKQLERNLPSYTNMFHTSDPILVARTSNPNTASNNTNNIVQGNKRPLVIDCDSDSNSDVSRKKMKTTKFSEYKTPDQKHKLKQQEMQKRLHQQQTTSTLIVPFINPNIKFTDWIFCDGELNGVKLAGKIVKKDLIPSIDKDNNTLTIDGCVCNVIYGKNYIQNNKFNYSDNGDIVPAGTELKIYHTSYTKRYLHDKRNVETYGQYKLRKLNENIKETESQSSNFTRDFFISNKVLTDFQPQEKFRKNSRKKVTHEKQQQLQDQLQLQDQQQLQEQQQLQDQQQQLQEQQQQFQPHQQLQSSQLNTQSEYNLRSRTVKLKPRNTAFNPENIYQATQSQYVQQQQQQQLAQQQFQQQQLAQQQFVQQQLAQQQLAQQQLAQQQLAQQQLAQQQLAQQQLAQQQLAQQQLAQQQLAQQQLAQQQLAQQQLAQQQLAQQQFVQQQLAQQQLQQYQLYQQKFVKQLQQQLAQLQQTQFRNESSPKPALNTETTQHQFTLFPVITSSPKLKKPLPEFKDNCFLDEDEIETYFNEKNNF